MRDLLKVKNLSLKSDDGLFILKNISFSLEEGTCLGIIGSSGSGKSSLGLSLMGLSPHKPSGEVLFENKSLLNFSEKEWQKIRGREIGIVFQDAFSFFNPLMKIGDQIKECRPCVPLDELLFDVGLDFSYEFLKKYPHELSGGMRQRVMLAMALSKRPKLLICDEITMSLDYDLKMQIIKLLKDLQKCYHLSLIFIDHHFDLVASISQEILVLWEGETRGKRTLECRESMLELYDQEVFFLQKEKNSINSRSFIF